MEENEEKKEEKCEEKPVVERLKEESEIAIKTLLDDGIQTSDIDILYKLTKINHIAKESENMNYGNYNNYGNYGRYDNYGREQYGDNYGRRGRDSKGRYRGHDYIDEMYGEYGRYEEGREQYNRGNYGAKNDTLKSLEYMLESATDFFKMLKSEANSQEEMNLIREYSKKISEM